MFEPLCCDSVRCTTWICWHSLRRLFRRSTKFRASLVSAWNVRLKGWVFHSCVFAVSKTWYLFWFSSWSVSERPQGLDGSTYSSESSEESGILAVRWSGGAKSRLGCTIGAAFLFRDGNCGWTATAGVAIDRAGGIAAQVGGCPVVPMETGTLTGLSMFLGTVVCTLCFSFPSNAGRPLPK